VFFVFFVATIGRSVKSRVVAGLLLLIGLSLMAQWVRSLYVADMFRVQTSRRWYYIDSRTGGIQFGTFVKGHNSPAVLPFYSTYAPGSFMSVWSQWVNGAKHCYHLAGFWYLQDDPTEPTYWTFVAPSWFLILLSLGSAIVVLHRRGKYPPGHCRKCGYDLRASKDKCPECGTDISPVCPSSPVSQDRKTI